MDRFEIEDIVTQDKHGIVYRANDKVSGRVVALRRFLPFGQNGGGLDKEEATAYEIAAKRLTTIDHPAMRAIILGSVDAIDGVPFLATEWLEGESLGKLLAGEPMEAPLVIDVVRIALEVSLVISHLLGEEAVWVETEVDSIVVGSEESGRGFTFWISPFKWLGGESESRKLSSIVTLVEILTGWNKKIVGDHAGLGLGGWLKWLRNNPDASVREALEMLAESTGNEQPAPDETLVHNATKSALPKLKQPSSAKPLLIAAAILFPVIAISLFFYHKTAKLPPVTADYVEQKISPIIDTSAAKNTAAESPSVPLPKAENSAAARIEARARKLSLEAAERSKAEAVESAELGKEVEAERKIYEERGRILSPDQAKLVRTFKSGDAIILQGTVRGVRTSGSGKSIYLNFSEPFDRSLTNGIIHKGNFTGNYSVTTFEKFIGKTVTLNGELFVESFEKSHYVKITSLDQIK